jgi:hypothetical protein
MALGLGQGQWQFASPDFPTGALDYSAVADSTEQYPFAGATYLPDTTQGVGPTHISTGAGGESTAGRAQHWSNLFDWRQGAMFWLAVATILYFGLVSLHVGARAGHFRVGAGSGR